MKKERKRFFSILLITALGVAMFTGLRASCNDLRHSADALYDEQALFDIQVSSTLGLDDDDIAALKTLDEVSEAEGEYSAAVYTDIGGTHQDVRVRTLGEKINIPTVVEGSLPQAENEIAVTEGYLLDSGKQIGDTLTFTENDTDDEDSVYADTEYLITAEILDPFDVNNREGSTSFRSSASEEYTFYVLPSAVDADYYTAVYVSVEGADTLMCYSDEYVQLIEDVKTKISDTLKEKQQQSRYDTVYAEALAEYNDALAEVMEELDDAQQEIDDGWTELQDGLDQLNDGAEELETQEADADRQIADGLAQIEAGYASLSEAKTQLDQSGQKLASGEQQLLDAQEELAQTETETFAQIDAGIEQLQAGKLQVQFGIDELNEQISGLSESTDADMTEDSDEAQDEISSTDNSATDQEILLQSLQAQLAALEDNLADLDNQLAALQEQRTQAEAQFAAAEAEIAQQEAELEAGMIQYESGLAQWNESKTQLDEAKAELEAQEYSAAIQFASAWETIRQSEQELQEARQELIDGQEELDENKEEALAELEDAREEIDEIEMAKWYIQSRDSLSGYSNVDNDAASIEGLSAFLPLIFLVVAILISLTAITRMVEEDRGLIGTYKALGFKNGEIRRKYVLYAAGASLSGGIVGNLCGFIVLPKIIFTFFEMMYVIPEYMFFFQPLYGITGILLFLVGILAAVWFAVRGELVQMPAALMRPLVPKNGTRIFLEYIPFIWKKLSFLNKVTARNLFRYKKRLIMTVIGIMGCTGLLVCAFAIKNTVTDLMPRQYENIYRYDILAAAQSSDNEQLLSYMDDEENIEQYVNLQVESVSIRNQNGESETVQMYVIPDDAEISDFIKLSDTDGNDISLSDDGIFITHSASDVLELAAGDEVVIQDLSLNETEIAVAGVAENYLGDMIYVSESCYESCFDMNYEPNAVLIRLTESCKAADPVSYAKELGTKDGVLSTVSTESLKEEFSQAFQLINLVVYVIFVMAAALAFVVLFTLSTTNISERCRELATIKVLGFFDHEVHLYVNKETLILSCIGIAFGLPTGWGISICLGWMLKIPGMYFAISIHHVTYLICAVIAFVFALIVNQITNRLLNQIDPVEALKSVE
ncbi:MAG: ABC transporter permease [Clostridiales bacterium]|nr:ABC transporter permease [Clostridiales bacterium]